MQQLVSSSPRMQMQRKALQAATGQGVVQRVGEPVALGQNQGNAVRPIAERPVAQLTMGQALVAHLGQLILFSDEFSSCSPVVMFDSQTLKGALMHFPAGSLEKQKENLRRMFSEVMPDQIILYQRDLDIGYNKPFVPPPGHEDEDEDAPKAPQPDHEQIRRWMVEDQAVEAGSISISSVKSNQYYVTLDEDGKTLLVTSFIPHANGRKHLSVMHDQTKEKEARIREQWADAPAAVKIGRDDWHDD
jgi:hypothetical protein